MDIIQTILNFLLITMLGLLIAFSPMIVIVNMIVVLKSTRPILRTIVLMAGMVAPLILVIWLASLFLSPDDQISLRGLADKINIPPIINLVFGLWILGLGWRRWQYANVHGGPKKSANLIMEHPPDKLSGLFMFAFVKSALSATNLFAVLLVCKLVITNQIQGGLAALAILWVILIGLLPFGVILYFYFFRHERLELLSSRVDEMLNRNLDAAINLGLIGIGALFSLIGVLHLLGD